jgi:hypothetical protein
MKLQFGWQVVAAAALLALPAFAAAQNPHPDRPPQRQAQPHANVPRPQSNNRPQPQNNRPNNRPNAYQPPQNNHQNSYQPRQNFNPPPNHGNPNGSHNGSSAGYVPTPRQQLGVGAARPWVDQMRDLSPGQRERVLQNSKAFQNLSPDKQTKIRQQFNQWDRMSPQQQTTLRENEATWRRLTPEQRDHIRNDVLPRMRQMPWERQQIINQKLGILKNMPESARNQRLNDPNFTRGMSDEERSTLHDLAHMHVGAPEPPSE